MNQADDPARQQAVALGAWGIGKTAQQSSELFRSWPIEPAAFTLPPMTAHLYACKTAAACARGLVGAGVFSARQL